jgi:hypothetical protein
MHNPESLYPEHPDQPVILLVEDDVLVLNIIRITLERDGYFVLTAEPGICVVLMSGSHRECNSAFVLLQKPFGPNQLSETIKGLLPVCQGKER